jgi:hypothetical protein
MLDHSDKTEMNPVPFLELLLKQPTEITTAIFFWLDIRDLLNVRISCKRLHRLVHDLSQSLYAHMSSCLRQKYGKSLHLLPPREEVDLASFIELQSSCLSILKLAEVLADHVASQLIISAASDKTIEFTLRSEKAGILQRQLFPYLFTLNRFLDGLGRLLAEADQALADWDDDIYVAAEDMFLLDQQDLVKSVCPDAESISGVSAAMTILLVVCKAKGLGPRTRAPVYPFPSIKRLMLLKGLRPFAELLEESDRDARRARFGRAGQAVLRVYQAEACHSNAPGIQPLDMVKCLLPTRSPRRPTGVIEQFLKGQNIWHKAACTILLRDFAIEVYQGHNSADAWIMKAIAQCSDPDLKLGDWHVP